MTKFHFFIILFFICSCTNAFRQKDPAGEEFLGKEVWTKTNLHLFQKQYIYWQNYLSGELLPVGTPLRLKEVYTEEAILTDTNNNDLIQCFFGSGIQRRHTQNVEFQVLNSEL